MTAAAALAEQATSPILPVHLATDGPGLDTRFGRIVPDPERMLSFPSGLPGFPGVRRFQLERISGSSLLLLQCLDDGGLGFFVMPLPEDTGLIAPADRIAACRLLALDPGCTDCLAVVTARSGPAGIEFHANLRAPLLVDTRRRIGAQTVLADAAYPLRHRVLFSN